MNVYFRHNAKRGKEKKAILKGNPLTGTFLLPGLLLNLGLCKSLWSSSISHSRHSPARGASRALMWNRTGCELCVAAAQHCRDTGQGPEEKSTLQICQGVWSSCGHLHTAQISLLCLQSTCSGWGTQRLKSFKDF